MKRRMRKRMTAMALAFFMVMSAVVPAVGASAAKLYDDLTSDHWAAKELAEWTELGIFSGYEDGSVRPNQPINRAEFAVLMNRTFGYSELAEAKVNDVAAGIWFEADIMKALAAGYLSLDERGNAEPKRPLTRAEAAVALNQIFGISAGMEGSNPFNDLAGVDADTATAVEAMAAAGYLKGFPDGTFKPNKTITRAELASLIDRMVGLLANQAGTVNAGKVKSNVLVNRADVVLTDAVIEGNLYLTSGIGQGDVTLERVTVKGKTVVSGGGENSIHIVDSSLANVIVNKKDNKIRLVLTGDTSVETINLDSKAVLEMDETTVIQTLNVSEQANDSVIQGKGKIEKANNKAQGVKFNDGLLPAGSSAPIASPPAGGMPPGTSNPSNPQNPTEPAVDPTSPASEGDWTLTWSDEFNDSAISASKWDYDIGNGQGGWGNQELEYYTNRSENVKQENGNLVITARKEAYEEFDYTSTRIVTRGKYAQKYGKIEARVSLPTGKGLWPAVWMLPEDYVYGTWASSGEIDIMEAWGSKPTTIAGTIHYGGEWPNNTYTGKEYELPHGSTIEDFHTYTIEWEPGEIRWYVDGVHYSTQNDWYSISRNQPLNNAYPAPFDQEFHLLMNLAVGGHFDGNPDETTVFPAEMKVDYVRMYELTGREYREPNPPVIPKEDLPSNARMPLEDGNLVYNSNFDQDDPAVPNLVNAPDTQVPNTDYWRLFTGEGGAGTVAIEDVDGTNFAKIAISAAGTQPYSVQMLNDVSIAKGRFYKLSFKAKAADARSMTTRVTGGESRGWAGYSPAKTIALTDQVAEYELYFQMKQDTDIAARTEFNVGTNGTAVWIGDVRVEEVESIVIDEDSPKQPLAGSGNHVYNGTFDQGDVSRMTYWHVTASDGATAAGSVDAEERKLNVTVTAAGTGSAETVKVLQKGMYLIKDQSYELSFDASANAARTIKAALVSSDGSVTYATQDIAVTPASGKKTMTFTMAQNTVNNAQLVLSMGGATGTIKLDNVKLIRTSVYYEPNTVFYPLQNGGFSEGLARWTSAADSGGANTLAEEAGAAKLSVTSLGTNPWSNMFIQDKLSMFGGLTYIVKFDAKSTANRKLEVIAENSSYFRYFDQTVDLTSDMQTFSYEFTMSKNDTVDMKFLLGNVAGTSAVGAHDVTIDNVVLEVKDAPVERSPRLVEDTTNNRAGNFVAITFVDDEAWRNSITSVSLNGVILDPAVEYVLSSGQLLIIPGLFEEAGNYTVKVEAEGYAFASVKQVVLPNDGNLVLNGDFASNGTAWGSWTGESGAATFDYSGGAAKIDISAVGNQTWSVQFFQEAVPVVAGKTYELSFKGSSTVTRTATVEFGIHTNAAPINLTTETQTITKQFTATAAPMKLNFLIGKTASEVGAHTITLDDIVIKEVTPVETPEVNWTEVGETLLLNGTFDTDLTNWSTHNQGVHEQWAGAATFSVNSGTVTAEVYQVGWDWWHIQLFQEGVTVTQDTYYKVSFDLTSEVERPVYVELTGSGAPIQKINVTPDDTSYEVVFRVPASGSFKFLLGLGRGGTDPTIADLPYNLTFDNIRLVKVVEDTVGGT